MRAYGGKIMARPLKKGVDYFPLDCVLNDEFKKIKARFGLTGFALIIILFQKIYFTNGYYVEMTEDDLYLFADESRVKFGLAADVIKYAVQIGLFDKEKFLKHNVLTSSGIQKRYLGIVKRRKEINLKNEYLCISYTQIRDIVNNNRDNVNNNGVNVDNNSQSKVNIYINKEEEREPDGSLRAVKRKSFIEYYMQKVNPTPSPVIISELEEYENKMEYECFCAIIDYCLDENKRNWSYIKAVLYDKAMKLIKTKEAFLADISLNKNKPISSGKKTANTSKIITEMERIDY